MWDVVSWFLFIVLIAGLIIVAGLLLRGYMRNQSPQGSLLGVFAPRPDRRLEVVEQATIDGRRKLLLVRRDHVEHLIMTGGPVDVVVETGIDPHAELRSAIERRSDGAAEPTRPHAAAGLVARGPRRLNPVQSGQ